MGYVLVRTTDLPDATKRVAEEVVRAGLAPFGVEQVTVKTGVDQYEEPVLIIQADFGKDSPPVGGQHFLDLLTELRSKLAEVGEERFPHVFMHRPDLPPPDYGLRRKRI